MSECSPAPCRVILLGASNLTISFPMIVENLSVRLGGPLDVLAALGHGRSYGKYSRVLFRGLPGILECGLWDALDAPASSPAPQTLALLTDVGNDLIYNVPVDRILDWLETCLDRLKEQQAEIVVTLLPIDSIERLSAWRYHLTKTLFFPGKGCDWPEMRRRVFQLNSQLTDLAGRYGAHIVEQSGDWYGFDPIHIVRSRRAEAWRQILSRWPSLASSTKFSASGLKTKLSLWTSRPAERRLFGWTQTMPQPAIDFGHARVWLY